MMKDLEFLATVDPKLFVFIEMGTDLYVRNMEDGVFDPDETPVQLLHDLYLISDTYRDNMLSFLPSFQYWERDFPLAPAKRLMLYSAMLDMLRSTANGSRSWQTKQIEFFRALCRKQEKEIAREVFENDAFADSLDITLRQKLHGLTGELKDITPDKQMRVLATMATMLPGLRRTDGQQTPTNNISLQPPFAA